MPQARGEAARITEEANAYREQIIANSEGEADRFVKLFLEYKKAPRVTRERLYLQAVESMLANSKKVMINAEQSNNLLLLPLEQMFNGGNSTSGGFKEPGDFLRGGKSANPSGSRERDNTSSRKNRSSRSNSSSGSSR